MKNQAKNIEINIFLPTGDQWGFILEVHGPTFDALETQEEKDGYIRNLVQQEIWDYLTVAWIEPIENFHTLEMNK